MEVNKTKGVGPLGKEAQVRVNEALEAVRRLMEMTYRRGGEVRVRAEGREGVVERLVMDFVLGDGEGKG